MWPEALMAIDHLYLVPLRFKQVKFRVQLERKRVVYVLGFVLSAREVFLLIVYCITFKS